MQPKTIKLSTPWNHSFLKNQLDPQIDNFKFEIDNDCIICDYWIVWGDLSEKFDKISVICPKENIIFLTDEAHSNKSYDPVFLRQFALVLTCRSDIQHRNIIKTHEINTWHVPKNINEVLGNDLIHKSKNLSVVCSDLTDLPGHKKRFAFVNKLIGHFKERIDVYGRGFNPIENKWDALAPYRYSVAIENSSIEGYFTEKLSECYLSHTYPIYYGAPDIIKYFDENSLLVIDIEDYKTSIQNIEKLIDEDPWIYKEKILIDQKLKYLKTYQLFPALVNICLKLDFNQKPVKNTIQSSRIFKRISTSSRLIKMFKRLK